MINKPDSIVKARKRLNISRGLENNYENNLDSPLKL